GILTIPIFTQPLLSGATDPLYPPKFCLAYNLPTVVGSSTVRPPVAPSRNTPLVVPATSIYTILQSPSIPRTNNESQPNAYDGQYYSLEMTFRAPDPYNHNPPLRRGSLRLTP
ncbi:hypothetical protein HAX54_030865, partial [Datura stramonium]|nr:hypothetical protein [Datura stramonium]